MKSVVLRARSCSGSIAGMVALGAGSSPSRAARSGSDRDFPRSPGRRAFPSAPARSVPRHVWSIHRGAHAIGSRRSRYGSIPSETRSRGRGRDAAMIAAGACSPSRPRWPLAPSARCSARRTSAPPAPPRPEGPARSPATAPEPARRAPTTPAARGAQAARRGWPRSPPARPPSRSSETRSPGATPLAWRSPAGVGETGKASRSGSVRGSVGLGEGLSVGLGEG